MTAIPRTIAALFNEEYLSIPIAKSMLRKFGWEMSVLIQHIHFNIYNHKIFHARVKEFPDDKGITRYWVRNTYSRWKEELFLTSDRTVRRMINFLEEEGIFISKEGKGRHKYYTIDYEKLDAYIHLTDQNDQSDNTTGQNGQTRLAKMDRHDWPKWTDTTGQNGQSFIYIEKEYNKRLISKLGQVNASLPCPPHPQEDAPSPPSIKKIAKQEIRGTRIPEDWELTDEQKDRSIRAGMKKEDIEKEVFEFKTYWESLSGGKAVKRDWYKTWQNKVKQYCDYRGLSFEHSWFSSRVEMLPSAVEQVSQSQYAEPDKHPQSDEAIKKLAEIMRSDEDYRSRTQEQVYESRMKLVSIGDGRAVIWVKERYYAYDLDAECAYQFPTGLSAVMLRSLLCVLREIDPTIPNIDAIEIIWEGK